MEEFLQQMMDKVGIDRATAEKVVAFLEDHAEDAVGLIYRLGAFPPPVARRSRADDSRLATARRVARLSISRSGVKDKLPGGLGDKLGGLF